MLNELTASQAVELAKECQQELAKTLFECVTLGVQREIQHRVKQGQAQGEVHINHTIITDGMKALIGKVGEVFINAPNPCVLELVVAAVSNHFAELGYEVEDEWFEDDYCTTTVAWGY